MLTLYRIKIQIHLDIYNTFHHSPSYGTVMVASGASRRRIVAFRCGASERCIPMHAEGIVVWVSFFESHARPLTKQVSRRVNVQNSSKKNTSVIKKKRKSNQKSVGICTVNGVYVKAQSNK